MRCVHCRSDIAGESRFCPRCGREQPDAPIYDEYAYEAFISYRHLPRDRTVARRLQRTLEGMHIPAEVRAEGGPARLGKLFRDEDELPTSDSLTDQITDALKRSRYLIVIATPELRESKWVQREVELFSSLHGRDRVIVALAAGETSKGFPFPQHHPKVKFDENALPIGAAVYAWNAIRWLESHQGITTSRDFHF